MKSIISKWLRYTIKDFLYDEKEKIGKKREHSNASLNL